MDILLSQILKFTPVNESEKKTKAEFIEFIASNPDCLNRSNLKGHLTASALIIDNETKSKALFVLHKKLGLWLQPGGHADGESNLLKVALKEAQEETGLTSLQAVSGEILHLDLHKIPARNEVPEHYHYDTRFLITADYNETLNGSDESEDIRWFDFSLISAPHFDSSIIAMLNKVKRF